MGSDENGIRQTPFSDAWPTPDVSGTGLNGTGDGFDQDSGPNGLTAIPWADKPVPNPSGARTADKLGPPPPATIQVDGASDKGSQSPWDITSTRNTVDKK
jgi:hypothetical protein